MDQPLVSVICACYNQSKYILESLESVKNQTYKNLEIVIWDDASQDNSVEIIENWIKENSNLKIIFTKNIKNKGICKSLNEAQNLTTGKYIQLLALDDILLPHKISKHVELLEKSSEKQVLVFTDAFLVNDLSELYQNRFIAYHKKYLSLATGNYFDDLLKNNFIPAMTILYKRTVFDTVGLWDENLPFEDYDMLLRISNKFDFIFDVIPSAKYRLHTNNTHKILTDEMQKSYFKIYLKYINHNNFINDFLLKTVVKLYENNELNGENQVFFSINKPKGFFEKWIAKNKSLKKYKYLKKLKNLKNYIIYSKI